jgi:hypothetical protein
MNLKSLKPARQRVATYAACFGLSTLVGCGGYELPTPPDMGSLVQQYENPTGPGRQQRQRARDKDP